MFTFADIPMDLDGIKVIYHKKGFYTKYLKKLTLHIPISKEKISYPNLNFCSLHYHENYCPKSLLFIFNLENVVERLNEL